MNKARYITTLLSLILSLSLLAQQDMAGEMKRRAEQYTAQEDAARRIRLANDFFAFLLEADYIDEPISFPAGALVDSVDVNVYYYVAEWYYGEGDYQQAIDYCALAGAKMGGVIDDVAKSDVYALLGAAYFRIGAFDKAADALNQCYEIDKASGDFDRMSSTLNSIASVFVAAGKPREAEKYVREAIAANSLTDNIVRRAVLFGTASELYRSLDDAEQALDFAQKALDTERLTGDSARLGVRLSQLASAQMLLSKVAAARRSLQEAIPLLYHSGNLHSWGICQNQMGDILASEDRPDEAAKCYLAAARLFMGQGDMYNELHAREGLYKATKASAPAEAMMHLERAKQLQDSIYSQETGEALGRYNAIYFNDMLQREKEHAESRHRTFVIAVSAAAILLLMLIAAAAVVMLRRHRREVQGFEQDITSLQDQSAQLHRQYQNMVADMSQQAPGLTEDDRAFLSELTGAISAAAEKGVTDIDTIAGQMHISGTTMHRRLAQTLSVTPKAYILQVRMQKAKYLLQNYRDMTASEVADKCGYTQVSNFTRAFTRYYGITPTEARYKKE